MRHVPSSLTERRRSSEQKCIVIAFYACLMRAFLQPQGHPGSGTASANVFEVHATGHLTRSEGLSSYLPPDFNDLMPRCVVILWTKWETSQILMS